LRSGPPKGREEDFWRALFRATYRAEFRVEAAGREDSILAANRAHFDGLLPLALVADGIAFAQDGHTLEPHLDEGRRKQILRWWGARRRLGKALNLVRLAKAMTTFEGGMRYAAWKGRAAHRDAGQGHAAARAVPADRRAVGDVAAVEVARPCPARRVVRCATCSACGSSSP
jgi:hypothetical protein